MTVTERLPILVVDDDDSMCRTLEDVLGLGGFPSSSASDGQTAIALARQTPPAVAIVDLRLPDMDGLDLAGRLQALDHRVQVVILTGNATVETAVRALRDEGCDYLVKPVRPDDLLRTVANAEARWHLQGVQRDLQEKTALLEALFQASPLPLVVVDTGLAVRFWNPAAERVFGWNQADVLGKRPPTLEPDREAETTFLLSDILRGRACTGVEVRRRTKDGRVLHMRMSGGPLVDVGGKATAALAIYEDITEQRTAEAHLQHVQRLDALGRLAGGVAHDFNNLVGVIRSEMDLALADEGVPPELRDSLASVRETADRAAALTRQLLTFARHQPIQPEVVGINTVVAELERMLHRIIGDRIRMVVRVAADAGSANVDRRQLEQVLTNLVVNARDAIDGTGRITITTRNDRRPGPESDADAEEWVVVSVTDTGSGIPESLKSRIFEPFFSTKSPGEGTGLGLATSHRIVQGMGGRITVESRWGVGSTFHVHLPRTAAEAHATENAAPTTPMSSGHEVVLVVEDHPELLDVTRRILVRQGYTVYAAVDEAEAVSLVDEMGRAPDLLLTDAHLTTGDGRELIARLRSRFPQLKCLLTSGSAEVVGQNEFDVPFLPKPYTLPALANAVRRVLDGQEGVRPEGHSGSSR